MVRVDSFIPAHPQNFLSVPPGRRIDLAVIHDMEWLETDQTAEACAKYFASRYIPASAHYNVDNNTVVRSVLDKNVAYAAPGANHNGVQIEHAGYARQTAQEWLDPYGQAMLLRSAKLMEEICWEHNIPIKFIGVTGLRNGERGITTHAAVSKAFGKSSHTDPGFNFPMEFYIALVQRFRVARADKPWPVPVPKWFWEWAGWKLAGSPRGKRPASAPKPGIHWAPGGRYAWAWARLKALEEGRK